MTDQHHLSQRVIPPKPSKPAKDAKPSKPAKDAKPSKPAKDAKPSKPAKATKPPASAKATKPPASAKATKPPNPAKATKPSDPAKATKPPITTGESKPSIPAHVAGLPFMAGDVDPNLNGFDPAKILTDFDGGTVSKLPTGQTLRQFTIISTNKTIFVAPGKQFAAWTFNSRVPGPTLRVTAGDRVRIHYINKGNAAHGIHFHGIHAGNVDAGFQSVLVGSETFYEFDAQPIGLHLYHCHMSPLFTHIYKGLYGFFIIDPPQPRPKAIELAMMINGFPFKPNATSDDRNDLYAINTVAYHFFKHPIPVPVNQLIRVYLGGMMELDRLFGFQMHGTMFNLFPTGTSSEPAQLTDSVLMCQGQRAILEFSFKSPGLYLFRSIYSLHTDKGFMGAFQAT
jgi:FtsP/CotA-like multicopper oxidase with cupredoxin domain